jgi:hypothetical protein
MGLPRPDASTPVHDYLAQHWSRMVILNWPCLASPLATGLRSNGETRAPQAVPTTNGL